jgi:hypothetical protein
MTEPTAILTTVIGIVAKLGELEKAVKDAEAKTLLADIQLNLASLKVELANQRDEMASLKNENIQLREELRAKIDPAGKMELRGGVYYFPTALAGRPDGPYCT